MPVRPAQLPALRGDLGPAQLHGADIEVPDLRGGFSHLIAALTAEGGRSTVSNVGIIARGYENFITKLELLGADFALEDNGSVPHRRPRPTTAVP